MNTVVIKSRIIHIPSLPNVQYPELNKANYSTKLQIANNFIPWRSTLNLSIKVSSSSSSASYRPTTDHEDAQDDVAEVVRSFYAAINNRDLSTIDHLIAENCVYEDLIIYPHPIIGRKALVEGYKSFLGWVSKDLEHVIDDITSTNGDSSTVGVTWHFEWKGKAFPYSRGCSFYRLEMVHGKWQIVYGREVVESSIKLGVAGLALMKSTMWLLQQFPLLQDRQ